MGLWVRDWECVRKVKEGLIRCDLFAFLTTEPNAVVAPIHPKALPVILSSEVEVERWLSAPWEEAKGLQRPMSDSDLILLPPRKVERGAASTVQESLL